MSDPKRRSSNALPFQRPRDAGSSGAASSLPKASQSPDRLRAAKIECDRLREKLQKSVIDNPQAAKKAALLIGLWIEGKEKARKKAG
jgi:hypothetical protein